MVAANRKVKKFQAADYGLAKAVAYQPIQADDPSFISGIRKVQGNAAIVLDQIKIIAATLRHSDPVSNTDWKAVADEVGQEGETAEDVEQAFKLISLEYDFDQGDDVDEPCVAGPSRAPGSGSVQNKAAHTTTPNKRAGPAPKKSAAGVKKATGKIGAKSATASKGKGKEKAIVEDTFNDDAMDIDEDEYEPAQPKATAKGKGKQEAVAPPEYSDA